MNSMKNKYGMNCQMCATAELYNQKPDDPMFKKFSPDAMKGVKALAKALRDKGLSKKK